MFPGSPVAAPAAPSVAVSEVDALALLTVAFPPSPETLGLYLFGAPFPPAATVVLVDDAVAFPPLLPIVRAGLFAAHFTPRDSPP